MCEHVVEHTGNNSDDTTRKRLGYALPLNTDYQSSVNLKKFKIME